jgi:hypothetical protein
VTEREPDITDDPREQGTGEGYPESNPEGTTPTEGTKQGPEAGRGDSEPVDSDEKPSQATGNPNAAGG